MEMTPDALTASQGDGLERLPGDQLLATGIGVGLLTTAFPTGIGTAPFAHLDPYAVSLP